MQNIPTQKKLKTLLMRQKTNDQKFNQFRQYNDNNLPFNQQSQYQHFKKQKQLSFDPTEVLLRLTRQKLTTSHQNLHKFYLKKKQFTKLKQNLNFQSINNEIKGTKQKVKKRNFAFSKPISSSHNINQKQRIKTQKQFNINNKQKNKLFYDYQDQQNQYIYKNKKNDEFIRTNIIQKIVLIQNILSQQQLDEFKEELMKKLQQIKKQYNNDLELKQKILKYYISYSVLSSFLQASSKDTQHLIKKKINTKLYYKMKEEMISLLANQDYFLKHIKTLKFLQKERKNSLIPRRLVSQERFNKHNFSTTIDSYSPQCSNNNFFNSVTAFSSNKQLIDRIEELLQKSKNNIKQAFIKFGMPHISFEMELQFKSRLKELNMSLFRLAD